MKTIDTAFTAEDLMLELAHYVNFSTNVRKRALQSNMTNHNNIEFSNLVRDWENGDVDADSAAETLANLL